MRCVPTLGSPCQVIPPSSGGNVAAGDKRGPLRGERELSERMRGLRGSPNLYELKLPLRLWLTPQTPPLTRGGKSLFVTHNPYTKQKTAVRIGQRFFVVKLPQAISLVARQISLRSNITRRTANKTAQASERTLGHISYSTRRSDRGIYSRSSLTEM